MTAGLGLPGLGLGLPGLDNISDNYTYPKTMFFSIVLSPVRTHGT